MASHYIGLSRGQAGMKASDFTTGTSSAAVDLEVRIDDGANFTKEDVVLLLKAITNKITMDGLTSVLTGARI